MRKILVAISTVAVLSGTVTAASSVTAGPTLTLSPDAGHPRLPFKAVGSGFLAGETVDLSFDGAPLGTAVVGESGSFHARVRVPATAPPGEHPVLAEGETSGLTASATFLVRMDWGRFLLDGANRWNRFENVLNRDNVDQLTRLWDQGVVGCFAGILWRCDLALAEGILYAQGDESVWALDPSTGDVLWSASTANFVSQGPIVVDGMVFVALDSGEVLSLDAATGGVIWAVVIDEPNCCDQELAADADRLYVPSDAGELFALNLHDGTVVWQARVSSSDACGAAVWGGVVYSGGSDKTVALEASTGATIWTSPSVCRQSAVYSSGLVFANPPDGDVGALDASTGQTVWSVDLDRVCCLDSAPTAADGILHVSTSDLGMLYALDALTGTVLWSSQDSFFWPSSPAVANGVLYVGSDAGRFRAYDPATGRILWVFAFDAEYFGPPIIADGHLYVSTGTVFAFGLPGQEGGAS